MPDIRNPEDDKVISEVSAILRLHSDTALGSRPPEAVAREWLAEGFDADEVEDWLRARCFDAAAARRLEEAGLTPDQAALRTREGAGDYDDTLGFKLTNGDLSFEQARRIITSAFWDD